MATNRPAKTRAAVFYGNNFQKVCKALKLSATVLDKENVASKGTCTKLNRGFRGRPIEEATKDNIIDFLLLHAGRNPELAERLDARGLVVEECILPATFRLTDSACAMLAGADLKAVNAIQSDRVTFHQINRLARGEYGVKKHVVAAARQIAELASFPGSLDELFEDGSDDPHRCYPSIYLNNVAPEVQLLLIRG
jgi:hypothetical protein